MTDRWTFIISDETIRALAMVALRVAPLNARVEIKAGKRTVPQSDRMWASLTDIARQVKYHGLTLSSGDFKLIFLDALKREVRMVPNRDGTGFVNLGRSSSDLTVGEMSDLLEIMYAYGAEHGVVFSDPETKRASEAA